MPPMQGTQVRSLVRELRSHMPCVEPKRLKKNKSAVAAAVCVCVCVCVSKFSAMVLPASITAPFLPRSMG